MLIEGRQPVLTWLIMLGILYVGSPNSFWNSSCRFCVSTRRLLGVSSLIATLAYPQLTVVMQYSWTLWYSVCAERCINYGSLHIVIIQIILLYTSLLFYTHMTHAHRLILSLCVEVLPRLSVFSRIYTWQQQFEMIIYNYHNYSTFRTWFSSTELACINSANLSA